MDLKTGRHLGFFGMALLILAWALPAGAGTAGEAPPAPVLSTDHPLAGRVWSVAAGRFVEPDQVVAEALAGRWVLLGETHDNVDHHALQSWVVRRLVAAGRRPVVAFEMFETDLQSRIDAHLASRPGDVAGIAEVVEWGKRGWNDWSQYAPIAEAALSVGGDVRAANLPRDLTRQIGRGKEDEVAAEMLGLNTELPEEEQKAFAMEIRVSHCNMLPEGAVANMVRVQRSKDATMADILASQASRPDLGPVVLIAGAGHVRYNRGVPVRLNAIAPGVRPFSLAFVEVKDGVDDPIAYAERFGASGALPFDAVWFTGRAERGDQCEELARQMKKKKG